MERFFSSGLLFDHLSSEKAAGNAGTCAVRCCWCDGAEDETPCWEKPIQLCPIMKSQMDLIYYILICGFISTCAAVKGPRVKMQLMHLNWPTVIDTFDANLGLERPFNHKTERNIKIDGWALLRETCSFAFKQPRHRFMATNGITNGRSLTSLSTGTGQLSYRNIKSFSDQQRK